MIKRILTSLLVALFVSGTAWAESDDPLPEGWLDELLREGPVTEGDAEEDEVVLDDEAAAAGEESTEAEPGEKEFVPALLSVEIRKQHPYACQYWVKLTNRLPFKIKTLALRFSAYITSPDYGEPVLFETLTRSFSELRPTDEKYLDLFYMNVPCEDIDYIEVADTGYCEAGEVNKFTAQSGDCVRYIEVEKSDMVTMFKVVGEGGDETAARKTEQLFTLVKQEDVDRLVARFIHGYEAGDIDKFVALFDANVQTDDGVGVKHIRQQYGELFETSRARTMIAENLVWKPLGEDVAEITFHVWGDVDPGRFLTTHRYLGFVQLNAYKSGQDLVISKLLYTKK